MIYLPLVKTRFEFDLSTPFQMTAGGVGSLKIGYSTLDIACRLWFLMRPLSCVWSLSLQFCESAFSLCDFVGFLLNFDRKFSKRFCQFDGHLCTAGWCTKHFPSTPSRWSTSCFVLKTPKETRTDPVGRPSIMSFSSPQTWPACAQECFVSPKNPSIQPAGQFWYDFETKKYWYWHGLTYNSYYQFYVPWMGLKEAGHALYNFDYSSTTIAWNGRLVFLALSSYSFDPAWSLWPWSCPGTRI